MTTSSRVTGGRAAIEAAWKALEGRNERELADLSGSRYSGGHILLPHFEARLTVDLESRGIALEGKEVDETSSILALHYLAGCGADVPTGTLVPFNQAEGGGAYYEAFKRRTIDRLAEEFGERPNLLVRAGIAIGGLDRELGASSIEVRVFPKVWVTLIVWEGDDEIPASANVLFDSTALGILPTEDLAVIGSLTVAKLVKAKARL
ncbi:MAG: DUF3786 domain-containing protein [Methanomassiliicoccales archaeon]|jgi:hypothetical protein|nr:DUF3786 domain-containing protein [Methanomassiliicoccales archaeon]MDD1756349.1 DUF3786 domain-containing protein [Methanomassiliicoccales archaeon]